MIIAPAAWAAIFISYITKLRKLFSKNFDKLMYKVAKSMVWTFTYVSILILFIW